MEAHFWALFLPHLSGNHGPNQPPLRGSGGGGFTEERIMTGFQLDHLNAMTQPATIPPVRQMALHQSYNRHCVVGEFVSGSFLNWEANLQFLVDQLQRFCGVVIDVWLVRYRCNF